ncbi:lonely Cys domain-containing protein, partial [Streptomyces griseoincarnatus]
AVTPDSGSVEGPGAADVLLAPPVGSGGGGRPGGPRRTAVPAQPVPRWPHIDFVDGRTDLDQDQLNRIGGLARRIVTAGVRDLSAGLGIPLTTVTGHGDGSRYSVASGPARPARWAGLAPARVVADALREAIRVHLQQTVDPDQLAAVHRVRRRWLTADDFPVDVRSAEADDPHPRPGHRSAVLDVGRSPLSGAVDTLKRVLPELDLYAPPDDAVSLYWAADLVLQRPRGATAPPPAPARPRADLTADALPDRLHTLYTLVADARAQGYASSVEQLTAFYLSGQGLFGPRTRLRAADGTFRGRNWTGLRGRLADSAARERVPGSNTTTPSPLPWPSTTEPFLFGTAHGSFWGTTLALPDGTRYDLSAAVFSELVAMDPDLAAAAPDTQVALVFPKAGAQGLELPRMTSFHSGRTVWAHTGRMALVADPQQTGSLHIEVSDPRQSELPLGTWVRSEPDDWDASDRPGMGGDYVNTVDHQSFWMKDLESVTLVLDGRPVGRMMMTPSDQAKREESSRHVVRATEWNDIDPVTIKSLGAPHPVPWKGRRPYVLWIHGSPGVGNAVAMNGAGADLTGSETVRYLKRRPSIRRLGRDEPIVVRACEISALPGGQPGGVSDETPFVRDPWGTVSWLQELSTGLDRVAFGPSRVHVSRGGPNPWAGVYTTALGEPGTYDEARPDPRPEQLDYLSRTAGVYGLITDAQDRRATTLRLVRGLRDTFGARVEDDPGGSYRALLAGLGALEAMRRADAAYAQDGPLGRDLLDRITRAHLGRTPPPHTRPAPVDLADIRTTLSAARKALRTDPSAGLSSFVTLPAVERARELLAGGAQDARIRQVLNLHPASALTEDHRLEALWATVEAVEALDGHPDTESLARRVLHLPQYETVDLAADGAALLWTAAEAAAAGRDVHDPVALAAHHLARHAALGPDTLLTSQTGLPVGWNLTTTSRSDQFDTSLYTVTDPATGTRSSHYPPWHDPADLFVLAVDPGTEPGTVTVPWPGRTSRSVPYDDFAELLRTDPRLRQKHPYSARVVLVGLGQRGTRKLADILSARRALGRTVLTARHPVGLGFSVSRNSHHLALITSDPDRDRDWKYHAPEALPPRPAAPAAAPPPAAPRPAVTSSAPRPAGRDGAAVSTAAPADVRSTPDPRADDPATGRPDPGVPDQAPTAEPELPHPRVEALLAEEGAAERVPGLAGDDWAGTRARLSVAEIRAAGVTLDQDQQAYAALMGGLTPAEAGLSLVQRYRLLRAWSGDDAPVLAEIAAALTEAGLDNPSRVNPPDGTPEPLVPQPAGEPMESRP